ncbi:hypothetical protein L1887_34021 [Cichorium endivia]|nr:hypothetical protein L1887_34021 [Cichorium endivia]
MKANETAFGKFINASDVIKMAKWDEVFHLMMSAAIEQFKDIHFYNSGNQLVEWTTPLVTSHMAWRLTVVLVGEYHLECNKRKRKIHQKPIVDDDKSNEIQVVGDSVNDSLTVIESKRHSIKVR